MAVPNDLVHRQAAQQREWFTQHALTSGS